MCVCVCSSLNWKSNHPACIHSAFEYFFRQIALEKVKEVVKYIFIKVEAKMADATMVGREIHSFTLFWLVSLLFRALLILFFSVYFRLNVFKHKTFECRHAINLNASSIIMLAELKLV